MYQFSCYDITDFNFNVSIDYIWKEQMESFNRWNSKVVMMITLRLLASALIVIIEIRGAAGSRI